MLAAVGATNLAQAAALYQQEAHVAERAARLAPGSWAPRAQVLWLAERGLREQLAAGVREARALEERAVEHLDHARQTLEREQA